MARRISPADLQAIEETVQRSQGGLTASQIAEAMESQPSRRTLQYRLRSLVHGGRLAMEGAGRGARYYAPVRYAVSTGPANSKVSTPEVPAEPILRLSAAGAEIQSIIRRPLDMREPVGYNRDFLDSYRPNQTFYLSQEERDELRQIGRSKMVEEYAATHAKQVLERLLIDLTWNSSRLEGNSYSLLETRRLINLGEEAEGKHWREARMILNHKEAIGFLIENKEEIGWNRYTILNLHNLLAEDLLDDRNAEGRLRHVGVGISGSVFEPLGVPQLVEECFDRILATASAIADPFEQAFFVLAQLPYLQPFLDVNKRVSRLAVNIPLLKSNLAPLSFDRVRRKSYTEALLGVYELNRTELLRDLFIWAYRRSAAKYEYVRQVVGDPDPFRIKYRNLLREVVRTVVTGRMNQRQALAHLRDWIEQYIPAEDAELFREHAERELLALHEGRIAGFRLRPAEFEEWQKIWNA